MVSPNTIFNSTKKVVPEEELDIKEFVDRYFRYYWYLYLAFAIIGIGAAYFYLQSTNAVYTVKSRLLIKEDKAKSFAPGDKLLKDLNLFGASENVSNEIQIIRSFSLMEQVVKDLQLNVQSNYQTWIKNTPAYQHFPILLDTFSLSPLALQSNDYLIEEGIKFEIKPIDYEQFELIHKENNLGTFSFGELLQNEIGTFNFLIEPPFKFNTDSSLFITIKDPESVVTTLSQNMQVSLVDLEATIVELGLNDELPQRGLAILNRLIEIYNEQTIEDKNKITRNSLKFINERLGGITEELTTVEGKVEQYKRKHEISSENAADLGIVMQEMSKYTEEQNKLEVELSILRSMVTFLENSEEFSLIPANLSVANVALTSSIQAYNQLVLQRQKMLETANISNPILISNQQQLNSLASIIATTISNLERDFQTKLKSIKNLNQDLSGRLAKVPTQERGLLEIKRQQVVKENLYLFLLQKREETALSLVATTANSKTIDKPRFVKEAIFPKKPLIYLGGLLGGLFLPFMFVVTKNIFQTNITTEEDIMGLTNASIIGVVSKVKKNKVIVVKKNSRSAIAERFRLIRTNLQFLNKKLKQQTILITSSVSGEGKTFIAINLALSFAITKQKTIILGLDLRKPKMKEYLQHVHGGPGLSELLTNQTTLDAAIHTYEGEPNLDYITSGVIPFNPHELLLEDSVAKLFADLKDRYDVIIIDAPPVGLVSDAILLSKFASDTIYVVRAGLTQKRMLEDANKLFLQKKLTNPHVLLNGLNINSGYGYQRYGYASKYGYYVN